MDANEVRNRIKVLREQARHEHNYFSKFGPWWSCVNAWLAFESAQQKDRPMIDWLKQATPADSRLKSSYDLAIQSDWFRNEVNALVLLSPIPHSMPGKEPIAISSIEDFPGIVEAIYQVRCRLVHGHMSPRNTLDIKLVMICDRILEKWIGNLVTGLGRTS